MATVQAEQYVAAEIAEIAWIDPTAPGRYRTRATGRADGFWPLRKARPAFRQGMSRSSS